MSNDITYYNSFPGYTNRLEETNIPDPGYLVSGSQNVIVDWLNSLASRRGYTLYGADGSTVNGGIQGQRSWRTSRGQFHIVRKWNQTLQVRRTNSSDTVVWETLWNDSGSDAFANQQATMDVVWNDTRKIDELLIAAGNVKFYSWSGATATIASTTSTTIVVNEDIGAAGFPATGTVVVNGATYTYSGYSGSTFTVTTDPTGEADDSFVMEPLVARSITGIPSNFTADYLGVFRNQAYFGSATSRIILVTDALDYTNFTTSTAVGGPRELTIDDNCSGFLASKKSMVIFGQEESLFEIKYTVSADQTKEYYEIERLATAPQQGLVSPLAKLRVKNAMMYITREKTLDTVSFIENIDDLQTLPVSDLIKNDFDATDFTGASLGYWERNLLIAAPASNIVYMYDIERKLWQAPIRFSGATISMFSIDEDGSLIGHDAFENTSYTLFTGTSDNGNPIESTATFAYNNFNERFDLKQFHKYVQDGYISPNGTLTCTIDYDYRGGNGSNVRTFAGSELSYVYSIDDSGGLGKSPLGTRPLSGSSLLPVEDLRRFRYADSYPPQDFYELRVTYSMATLDGAWRLVAHGANVFVNNNQINDITREE